MFAKSVIALAVAAAAVSAAPVEPRNGPSAPKGWAYGYLEDYETYHVRYLALKCYNQHNTQFFEDCCRPMLSTENLQDNRKSYCVPSDTATESVKASLSAKYSGATATASADTPASSEDCETGDADAPSTTTTSTADYTPAAKPSKAEATTSDAATTAAATTAAAATTSAAGEEKWAQPAPSSSSTTTTQAWTPAPTTEAPAPTTQAPQPTQQSSGGGETMNGGYATYFYQGGNAGACGTVHGDYDMIVAIDQARWGSSSFGSGSSTCGRWLTITNTNNGRSVSAMVADVCPTCANGNSLDLSVGAFTAIASTGDGMVPISWHWN